MSASNLALELSPTTTCKNSYSRYAEKKHKGEEEDCALGSSCAEDITRLKKYLESVLNKDQIADLNGKSDYQCVARFKEYLLNSYFYKGAIKNYVAITQQLTQEEKNLCNAWHISEHELLNAVQTINESHPHLASPTTYKGLGPCTETTPTGRLFYSRLEIKEKQAQQNRGRKRQRSLFTSDELKNNHAQKHAELNAEKRRRLAQEDKVKREQADSALRQNFKTRAGFKQHVLAVNPEAQFQKMVQWMQGTMQEKGTTMLTKAMIHSYFVTHIEYLYEMVLIDGLKFLYPKNLYQFRDITDQSGRSNMDRLKIGMNPVYLNQEGHEQSFHWHHLTFDQLSDISYCVLVTQEIHALEGLHPRHLTLGVERDIFNKMKLLANQSLATILE